MVDRYRFAPSPTGYLHVGNARAALFNWFEARRTGAELLLRVEDTDTERNQLEAMESIFAALKWLGIDWDGEIVFQAHRLDEHREAAAHLLADGKAYWCDCTAEQVQARAKDRGGPPGYDGFCRDRGLPRSEATALRFRSPDEGQTSFTDLVRGEVVFENATIEDFVLLRSNGTPVFLLSNALDDAEMGITHVVRGEDHVPGTPKYLMIREAMGLGRPTVFAHLPMLVNESRKKLSKRRDAVAVGDFMAKGFLPDAMVNYLALLGWGPPDGVEIRPVSEIVELFRLEDVHPSPAFFDIAKLTHFNGEYIRAMPVGDFLAASRPHLLDAARSQPVLDAMAPLVQERVKTLAEVEEMIDFLYRDGPVVDEADWAAVITPAAVPLLDDAITAFESVDWAAEPLKDALTAVGASHDLKLGKAQAPVRVAVSGRKVGPPLFESLEVLGRDETLRRLRAARAQLEG